MMTVFVWLQQILKTEVKTYCVYGVRVSEPWVVHGLDVSWTWAIEEGFRRYWTFQPVGVYCHSGHLLEKKIWCPKIMQFVSEFSLTQTQARILQHLTTAKKNYTYIILN